MATESTLAMQCAQAASDAMPALHDFESLSEPHVAPVWDVLHGRRTRYKLHFENVALVFYHGCLQVRIFSGNRLFALPVFILDETGRPAVYTVPPAQQPWLDECLEHLPKSVLLFLFTLLKAVFDAQPLVGRWQRADGAIYGVSVPRALKSVLTEVGWASETV